MHTSRLRGGAKSIAESATAWATVTFSCIDTEPGAPWRMRASTSPVSVGNVNQPSAQARIPRAPQVRA